MRFENYLEDKFMEVNPGLLDDDLPDAFETWMDQLDVMEVIDMANQWGKMVEHETKEGIIKRMRSIQS